MPPRQVPLTDSWKEAFTQAYEGLGGLGERVLGFCDIILPAKEFPRGYDFVSEDVRRRTDGVEPMAFMALSNIIRYTIRNTIRR